MMRRRYVDGRYGQLHLRENGAVPGVPLACLHATAYSSRSFGALLDVLEGRRHALAVDTPGYGESDSPPQRLPIEGYAEAILDALPEQVDLLGYHTGVSIAVEMAIRHPERVRRLVLMGIPHFRALDFEAWRTRLTVRHELGASLDQFKERWDFLVTKRPAGLPLARGFQNFLDELKAWPLGWWAHESLFQHDLEARLPMVSQPVLVINPGGHLAEPSRVASRLLADVQVEEMASIDGAVLDTHASLIAACIDDFLEPGLSGFPSAARSLRR